QEDVTSGGPQHPGILVLRGQCVPIGDEEETTILVLQFQPVLEHPEVVPEVKFTGRTHPADDGLGWNHKIPSMAALWRKTWAVMTGQKNKKVRKYNATRHLADPHEITKIAQGSNISHL